MVSRSPAVPLFVAAAVGASVGLSAGAPSWVLAALAVLLSVGVAGARGAVARAGLLLTAAVAVGATAGATHRAAAVGRSSLPRDTVVLEGVVGDIQFGARGGTRLLLDVTGVLDAEGPRGRELSVQVFAPPGLSVDAAPGDRVRVRGRVRSLQPAYSPGEFDGAALGLARGIDARLSLGAANDLAVLERGVRPAVFARMRLALRARMLELLPPRLAGLELALLVGDTSLLDDEQRALYRHVGAGHLLAVSGLQVTLLALLLRRAALAVLFSTSMGRRGQGLASASVAALLGVLAFVLLCGAPPSAVRAAAMASAVLLADLIGRRVRLLDALGIAGLATLLLSPASVIDPSFLLSYGAVIGLAASTAPAAGDGRERRGLVHTLVAVVVSSVGAGLVTLPVSAALFGEVAPAGLVANIVLVPLASTLQVPALGLGLAGALLGVAPLAWLGAQAALLLEATAAGLGELLPEVRLVSVPDLMTTVALVVCALAFAVALARRRSGLGAAATCMAAGLLAAAAYEPEGVRISVLPVGQGDSAVFEMPDGTVMLVDGGGVYDGRQDPGADVVLPFLARRGIRAIDVMVLSHPHPDHALGLISVARAMPVHEFWHNGGANPGPLLRSLLGAVPLARVRSTPELLGQDARPWGGATVEVLAPAPPEGTPQYPELGANDNSIVLRVCFRGACALWPGDIEEYGEELLLASGAEVRADVVKVPHHGSRSSSTAALLRKVGARHAVFCTGPDNAFRFPHREVLARWRETGVRPWDTAVHGELIIRLAPVGVEVEPYVAGEVGSPEDG